jgi:anti-sigma factor ChrR (cupin superfamily)
MLNPHEYEDLLALAALDEVDARDMAFIAEDAQKYSELAVLKDAFHTLAYTTPPLSLTDNLKERLFQKIAAPSPFLSLKSSEQKWQPHPLVAGIEMAILRVNEKKREIVVLLRCSEGVRYPLHRHADEEEILVLEGDVESNGQIYQQGDYLYCASDSVHDISTRQGCLLYIRSSLDNQYLHLLPS